MKHFMIKYQFANGPAAEWHRDIGRFIAALNEDPTRLVAGGEVVVTPMELIAETNQP